jgi:exosortase
MAQSSHKINQPSVSSGASLIAAVIALSAILFWSYWPTFIELADRWAIDPQYSHGYLVPLFALALLVVRLKQADLGELRPSVWGFPLLLPGVALRHAGTYFFYLWFDPLSLIPCLCGICLLLGGRRLLRIAAPSIVFLFFMIPLPFTLESALRAPLQSAGTLASTYLMQTIGLPAISEGNVVVVNDHRIGVVEACSGLRMLMVFFALSTAVAFLIQRPTWERIVVILSSIPIALISNIARITVTGVIYVTASAELADYVFHDLAGWLMMPFALFLLWIELKFLSLLWIVEEEKPLALGFETSHPQTAKNESKIQSVVL